MKIGIFGGRFDPIHFGHLLLAETALQFCGLDRVLFVPTGKSPHKQDQAGANGIQRAEMIQLAIHGYNEYAVSRFEIESPEVSFTVNTLHYFHAAYQNAKFYLILGADSFNDLPHWYETDKICRLALPIVACRADFPMPHFESLGRFLSPKQLEIVKALLIPMPQIEISSRLIRTRIAERKSIRFLTPSAVESYIIAHRLYQKA